VDLHTVLLVEGDFVGVEDVETAADCPEVAREHVRLGQMVIGIAGAN
jgi:hypothetical protein